MRDPKNSPSVSVVLPTFNERGNIGELIRRLTDALDIAHEVIVVDDGSTDGTVEEVRVLASQTVRLIERSERGLTSAIQRGIDEGTGEVVVWMDCDLSMPPEKVPELVERVLSGEADAAVGSRYVAGGADRSSADAGGMKRVHTGLAGALNRLARRMLPVDFYDWTSGFIAIRSSVIKSMRLEGDYGDYFILLIATLYRDGARVEELPYEFLPRVEGASKTTESATLFIRRGLRYLRCLFKARQILRGRAS